MVVQAYRFALDPSPAQQRALVSHAGAARFAWNWGLARCQERYAAEGKWYSGAELHKLWNAAKKTDPGLAWWGENSKCAYQESLRDLDRALREFIRSKNGQRAGQRLGFPRYKKRGRCKDSFRFSTGAIRCDRAKGHAAPPRHRRHPRVHPQAGPPAPGRLGAHPVGHGVAHGAAVARVVHGRRRAGHAGPACPARLGDRDRPGRQDPADRRRR